MEAISNTINRHTPIVPESLHFGVSPVDERRSNRIIRNILWNSNIDEITRWRKVKGLKFPPHEQLEITEGLLNKAEKIANDSYRGMTKYLQSRGITDRMIYKYKICSTSKITQHFEQDEIENLGLCLPKRFEKFVKTRVIEGVSIPYYLYNKFCGFATRVTNSDFSKYVFTCPNRMFFGVNFNNPEVYVVEGVFDAISLIERGYNAAALCDSRPNYFKMHVAARFRKINLLFDGDYAGCLGALKSYIILTKLFDVDYNRISILMLPDGSDPEFENKWNEIPLENLLDITSKLGSNISNDLETIDELQEKIRDNS